MTTTLPLSRPMLVGACAVALALTGCGSSDEPSASPTTSTPTTSSSTLPESGAPPGQGSRVPGASGTIAALDGTTLQVQGNGEQTAVIYTSKTTMTAQVATRASALAVGDCVSVRDASDTSAASMSPSASDTLAATTVTILSTDGCDAVAVGGGQGGPPGGGFPGGGTPPSGMPSGVPSGMPSGGPPGGRGFGGLGEVTAIGSGSFTLSRTVPGRPGGTTAPSPTASAPSPVTTVTYDGDTSFLTTTKATASAITVGSCVRATGTSDDTGTLTATALALSQPTEGSCTMGVRGG